MRILFFSHYFPPEVNAPAVRTFEHCSEWVRQGHEVHVVTCVPNHPQGEVYEGYQPSLATQREEMDGIQVHRVWTYIAPNKGFLRRTLGYVSYMFSAALASLSLPRPEVIVATSPQFFCACAGFLASKIRRAPWVFELRDLWPESIVAVGAIRNPMIIGALESVELFLYGDSEHVVSVTPAFQKNLVERGVDPDKVEVVTNGIDPDSWDRVSKEAARAELDLPADQFIASYIGTHGMAHNLETLFEAADRLREEENVHFITAGDGAEFENLKRLRREKGLENVTMLGQVPRERAQFYLHASDASLVLLRDSDLFKTVIPSKIFEAMAAGNPVLLGVDGEARSIVEEANAGIFVEPENAEELARATLDLKESPELRRELGQNGREAVRKRFDRKKLANQMLDCLRLVSKDGDIDRDRVSEVVQSRACMPEV